MRVLITLTFLFAYLMPMIYAQSTASVWVMDSSHPGDWGYFETHFVGLKLDSGGSSHISFLGGDSADYDHVLTYSDHYQTGVFQPNDNNKGVYITATGTYWIYLSEQFSVSNVDWLEVRVVANSFSGTITSLYSNVAPVGWYYGYPPLGTHMMITNGDDTPTPPATQAPPTNIKTWLIPLLIVIIVATIAIPSTIYLIRRRNAKKLAALTGNNTPQEISSNNHQDVNVQMHEVRV